MSDDTKVDATSPKTDAKGEQGAAAKTYDEAFVKELIADRDKAKDKLRKREEAEKVAAEEEAKKRGEFEKLLVERDKELAEAKLKLDEANKVVQAEFERKAKRKEALLTDVKDEELKKVYSKLDVDDLELTLKKLNSKEAHPFNAKGKPNQEEGNPLRKRPGETYQEWDMRLQKMHK
jgi:hypothetical protein